MLPYIKAAAPSGDDIGQKNILQLGDAILERQLALFEALNEHAIGHMRLGQRIDCRIEIAVFLAFCCQFQTIFGFLFFGERQHQFERTQTP